MSGNDETSGLTTGAAGADPAAARGKVGRQFLNEVFQRHYNGKIQMSASQVEAVASAILSRGPDCNLLVFGLGNDSALWHAVNAQGYTLFIEDVPDWIANVKAVHPDLQVDTVSYQGTTVGSALRDPVRTIRGADVPDILRQREWDVIIIDGPMGYAPQLPGRSLPICWAKQLAKPSTHIFVDDYDRELERTYVDFLFPEKGPRRRLVISRPATKSSNPGSMIWLMGVSPAFGAQG